MKRFVWTTLLATIVPSGAASGGIVLDSDSVSFASTATGTGYGLMFTEDFEEATIPAGSVATLDDPLLWGIANVNGGSGWGFTTGLDVPGLSFQSNLLGTSATTTSPRGASALMLIGPSFAGSVSNMLVNSTIGDSFDIIFDVGQGAVGFDVIKTGGGTDVFVQVYDPSDVLLIATFLNPADMAGTNFLGITATGGDTIGRINIAPTGSNRVGADNIQMWSAVPGPGPLALLAVAGMCGLRRRRRIWDQDD